MDEIETKLLKGCEKNIVDTLSDGKKLQIQCGSIDLCSECNVKLEQYRQTKRLVEGLIYDYKKEDMALDERTKYVIELMTEWVKGYLSALEEIKKQISGEKNE